MDPMATWEKLLLGVAAVLIVLWFRPGIRAAMERSRQAGERDWKAVILPLVVVVLFVLLLIASV
ncbi:MAG: hypothetical protein PHF72_02285 [Gammaproteobacteria bacterium]|nr:hypothetical protein [Gammaproteobacteria bacterium]